MKGERRFDFPRTVSFGNWPFLVFLVFLASVLSILPARAGEWHIVAAFFGAIAVAPALIGVTYYALEPFGNRVVDAIHDEGLVWRRGWRRGFVQWMQLISLERKDVTLEGMTFPRWELTDDEGTLLLEDHPGCVEGAQFIEEKLASLKRRY